jgi:hypothetical protein
MFWSDKVKYRSGFIAALLLMLLYFSFITVTLCNKIDHSFHPLEMNSTRLNTDNPFKNYKNKYSDMNKNEFSDWVAIPLAKMIGTASLIVWGYIENLTDSSYIFKIITVIRGSITDETIEVLKYTPDKFESEKPPPYNKNQRYILFLVEQKEKPDHLLWKVMGFGGEGQIPVQDRFVYFQGNNIKGLTFSNYLIFGVSQHIQRFDFTLFLDAVKEYNNCFRWAFNNQKKQYMPQQLCDEVKLKQYANKSFIHKYITNQTISRISK